MRKSLTKLNARLLLIIAIALTVTSSAALADPFKPAVLLNPDEPQHLRSRETAESPSVARITKADVFYTRPSKEIWWPVQSNENKTGFLKGSAIRIIDGTLTGGAPSSSKTPADIEASATPTDAQGQYALGWKFMRGIGVEVDTDRAVYWFAQAGMQGHLGAGADLANLLFRGERGVKRNRKLAYTLLEDGLAKGHARSLMSYASCLAVQADESNDTGTFDKLTTQTISLLDRAAAAGGEDGMRAAIVRAEVSAIRSEHRADAAGRFFNSLIGGGGRSDGERCSRCGGTGRDLDSSGMTCQYCSGTGYAR